MPLFRVAPLRCHSKFKAGKHRLISKAIVLLTIVLLIIIPLRPLGSDAFAKDSSSGNTKILLIGMDGLEWSVIKKLIKVSRMPTFAELIENGAFGNLRTFLDYSSPALWTTISTGKMPTSHGITSYLVHDEGRYDAVRPMSSHRKVKALWNILTEQKKKVGVINYLCTEPPETVNGFIVPYPITELKDAFPNSLAGEINLFIKNSPETAREFFNNFRPYCYYKDELSREIREHLVDGEVWRLSVIAPYLYQKFNKSLDLSIVYIYETDYISHKFWKFIKPDTFQHELWGLTPENIKEFGGVIADMYVMVDKFVRKLIENVADENTTVIICSDHGFRSESYNQNGVVVPYIVFSKLDQLLEKMGFLSFRSDVESKLSAVDFSKTRAYHYQLDEASSFPNVFISVNLKGRETNGIVEPGKGYAELKRDLVSALSNLKIAETGERLFDKITELTDTQRDIKVTVKTDVGLLKQHVRVKGVTYPLSDFYVILAKSGTHSDPAVLIIYGKNIRKGELIINTSILDITPTILYLLGLPVAKDMEGDILVDAIDTDFLKRNPIKYIDSYENTEKPAQKKFGPHVIGAQELEKLRSLGYVH